MPEHIPPGVFIEEIERGLKPIEGVATSTAAFLGETERGPLRPRLVSSNAEYLNVFGNVFGAGKYLPFAIKAFFDNGGRRCYVARIVGGGAHTATATLEAYTVNAIGPGDAGNRMFACLDPGTTKAQDGAAIGFRLRVFYWDRFPSNATLFDPTTDLTSLPRPSHSEDFDDVSTDPNSRNYFKTRVNDGNSTLIELLVADNTALPTGHVARPLQKGADGAAPLIAQYEGEADKVDDRRGLAALELDPYQEVAIIYAPAVGKDVIGAVIAHCENSRFRFAVIDSDQGKADPTTLNPRDDNDTTYGAFYYPWYFTDGPISSRPVKIPPGGAMCGIYARSDNTRGVWKAPANETVAGALELEYDIDQRAQETLNPRGVNVIRRFPGRGIRVWGARTLSSDPLWKYVNVRRLFIFIEASIYQGTRWVVFEPNDDGLWARVKQSVALFLRTLWREGALFGAKEEEAFTVTVGRETMTEDDIRNGRLVVEIGIAPVRAAEFVIFRVYQETQEAKG